MVTESDFPHIFQTFRLIEFSQVYFVLVSLFIGPPAFTHSDLSRDLTTLSYVFLQVSAFHMLKKREAQRTVITYRSANQRRAQIKVSVRRLFGHICVKVCV